MFYLFLASTIILSSTWNVLAKVWLKNSEDERAFAVLYSIVTLLLVVASTLLTTRVPSFPVFSTSHIWAWVGIIAYAITDRIKFYAYKNVAPSTLTIIMYLSLPVSLLLAAYLYNDIVPWYKIIAVVGLLLVNLYVVLGSNKFVKVRMDYLLLSTLVAVLSGIGRGLSQIGEEAFGFTWYNLIAWFVPLLVIAPFPFVKVTEVAQEAKLVGLHKIVMLGLIQVTSFYAFLGALREGPAVIVLSLFNTVSILTFAIESFLLKNVVKDKVRQGILVMIAMELSVLLVV